MPTARLFCARRMTASSTSCGDDHHQVGELVDHDEQVRQLLLATLAQRAVRFRQAPGAQAREPLVAALHLGDDVGENGARLLRARDDGRQQVREPFVVAELDPLRVDQDQPHLVRRRAQQDRREDRVDAARLARAGGAGDQDVRHPREIGPDGRARDVLAEPYGQRARRRRQVVVDVAERDEVRREVRHLDADGLLAGDRREDADLGRRQRVGEVVLEVRNLADLRAGRELQLVARDARAGDHRDHRRLDTEVRKALHECVGRALVRLGVRAGGRVRAAQKRSLRQLVLGARRLVDVEEGGLCVVERDRIVVVAAHAVVDEERCR